MDNQVKQRVIGAVVLVALAVIFVPMLLEKPDSDLGSVGSNLPEQPDQVVHDRIEPLSLPEPPAETEPAEVVLDQAPDATATAPVPGDVATQVTEGAVPAAAPVTAPAAAPVTAPVTAPAQALPETTTAAPVAQPPAAAPAAAVAPPAAVPTTPPSRQTSASTVGLNSWASASWKRSPTAPARAGGG